MSITRLCLSLLPFGVGLIISLLWHLAGSSPAWQPQSKARELPSPGSMAAPRKDFDWPGWGHVPTLGAITAARSVGNNH